MHNRKSEKPYASIGRLLFLVLGLAAVLASIWYFQNGFHFPAHLFRSSAFASEVISGPDRYARDAFGSRFYPENQITPANVKTLQVAWETSTGDGKTASVAGLLASSIGFECSPIFCHNRMIIVTPTEELEALDPGTGDILWKFDPPNYTPFVQVNRGAACWTGPKDDPHPYRILYSSGRNFCEVDADTGKLIENFGNQGVVDMAADVSRGHPELYRYNTPALIVGDTAICGSAIDDDVIADTPSGVVRAFDIHTGKVRWSWDMIPRAKDDPARMTWAGTSADTTGSGNVWSMMSYDEARHLIYLPTSSPANDDFGGTRLGDNKYCNSIVCLNADTGQYVWSFQVVHHDIWDYDIPAQPLLFDYTKNGAVIPSVAVATKMGRIFLFNRVNGDPLFPIREVPVPQTDVPGEKTSPTQPLQDLPPPLVPQTISPDDAWGPNAQGQEAARRALAGFRCGPIYNPGSLQGTVHNPGRYGGCNWAGMTFDQKDGLIIATATNIPFFQKLVPRAANPSYSGPFPMNGTPFIIDLGEMMTQMTLSQSNGLGSVVVGFPVVKPPWGKLVAIDPVTGQFRWERPVGYIPEVAAVNLPGFEKMGSPVVGGAITTASGLTIVAGTRDGHLRAFASDTGEELATIPLPCPAAALPVIYTVNGKEYLVICCGGHGFLRAAVEDHVMAFALPDAPAK